MARLEIGYLLPTREQDLLGEHDPGRLVAQARRAEVLGLDSVWAGDSPVTRPRADPLMLLAAVAQATERVALGTAVLLRRCAIRSCWPTSSPRSTACRAGG